MRRRDFIAGVGATLVSLATRARAATPTIAFICRRAWGARKPKGKFKRHTIHRVTVHHSGAVFWDNRDAPARVRSIQAYHQSRGWPDIAYHFVIDRHGNIYKGRPVWAVGDTGTNYDPRGHLLVMCLGNFNEQAPTKAMMRSLVRILTWACEEFDVPARKIRGHSYYAATACPGAKLQKRLGNVRRRVRRHREAGGVRSRRLCGKAGARRVRRIEAGTD